MNRGFFNTNLFKHDMAYIIRLINKSQKSDEILYKFNDLTQFLLEYIILPFFPSSLITLLLIFHFTLVTKFLDVSL